LLAATLLFAPLARAACPASADQVARQADQADAALRDLRGDDFLRAMAALSDAVACANEPLPVALIARVHRAQAVLAFSHGDDERTLAALRAAHAVEPRGSFEAGTLPDGHPLLAQLAVASSSGHVAPLPTPAQGALWVDGRRTADLPTDRAALVQLAQGDGVALSAYHYPHDPVPDYTFAATAPSAAPRTLARVSLVSGVGAAALYAGALASKHQFQAYDADPGFNTQVLERRRARTDALGIASGGAAAVTLLTGGIALRGSF